MLNENDPTGRERPQYPPPLPPESPKAVSNSSVNSREADARLIDMVSGQMLTFAREMSKFTLTLVLIGILGLASTAWLTWRMGKVEDTLAAVVNTNEQAKKHVWELKSALGLKFSQERSSRGESQTTLP